MQLRTERPGDGSVADTGELESRMYTGELRTECRDSADAQSEGRGQAANPGVWTQTGHSRFSVILAFFFLLAMTTG